MPHFTIEQLTVNIVYHQFFILISVNDHTPGCTQQCSIIVTAHYSTSLKMSKTTVKNSQKSTNRLIVSIGCLHILRENHPHFTMEQLTVNIVYHQFFILTSVNGQIPFDMTKLLSKHKGFLYKMMIAALTHFCLAEFSRFSFTCKRSKCYQVQK